jgi:hypothetical protein
MTNDDAPMTITGQQWAKVIGRRELVIGHF